MKSFPLNICKAITIHKSQGMTIGHGQFFEYLLLFLPSNGNTPGMELVALSRPTELERFALLNNNNELDYAAIMNIGKSKAYQERRNYLHELADKAKQDQENLIRELTELDTSIAKRTLHGGCMFLLKWYRSYTNSDRITLSRGMSYHQWKEHNQLLYNLIIQLTTVQFQLSPFHHQQ